MFGLAWYLTNNLIISSRPKITEKCNAVELFLSVKLGLALFSKSNLTK